MRNRRPPVPRSGSGHGRITVRRLARTIPVTTPNIVAAVRAALGDAPLHSIGVGVLDDAAIASLHEQFMGIPGPTDVLTFDLRDNPDQPAVEGEIAVSADTAHRQARRYRTGAVEELLRYVIHGVLHLRGYDDDTPAGRRRMRREETRVLASLNRHGQTRRASREPPGPGRRPADCPPRDGRSPRRRHGRHV